MRSETLKRHGGKPLLFILFDLRLLCGVLRALGFEESKLMILSGIFPFNLCMMSTEDRVIVLHERRNVK